MRDIGIELKFTIPKRAKRELGSQGQLANVHQLAGIHFRQLRRLGQLECHLVRRIDMLLERNEQPNRFPWQRCRFQFRIPMSIGRLGECLILNEELEQQLQRLHGVQLGLHYEQRELVEQHGHHEHHEHHEQGVGKLGLCILAIKQLMHSRRWQREQSVIKRRLWMNKFNIFSNK